MAIFALAAIGSTLFSAASFALGLKKQSDEDKARRRLARRELPIAREEYQLTVEELNKLREIYEKRRGLITDAYGVRVGQAFQGFEESVANLYSQQRGLSARRRLSYIDTTPADIGVSRGIMGSQYRLQRRSLFTTLQEQLGRLALEEGRDIVGIRERLGALKREINQYGLVLGIDPNRSLLAAQDAYGTPSKPINRPENLYERPIGSAYDRYGRKYLYGE